MKTLFSLAASAVVLIGSASLSHAAISYVIPAGTLGNQGFGTGLGMDFDVGATPIVITSFGVFDDASDGIGANATLSVALFERDPGNPALSLGQVGSTVAFTNADPGTLIGGSRFKTLDTSLTLPAGFQGSIVAYGFTAAPSTDQNGNAGSFVPPEFGTTDDGGGLINFVGTSRFGLGGVGVYPDTPDGGDVNRYGAGTFEYRAIPEPASAALILGALGLLGYRRRRR